MHDQTDSFIHLNYLQNENNLIGVIDRQKFYLIDIRVCIIYNSKFKFSSLKFKISVLTTVLNPIFLIFQHTELKQNQKPFKHKLKIKNLQYLTCTW